MTRQKVFNLIRQQKGWSARIVNQDVRIARVFGIKKTNSIDFNLALIRGGGYYLEHPTYERTSAVAHFKPIDGDRAKTMNKSILKSVIGMLKRTGIWKEIENKRFLKVNDYNIKSNKDKVGGELKKLLK